MLGSCKTRGKGNFSCERGKGWMKEGKRGSRLIRHFFLSALLPEFTESVQVMTTNGKFFLPCLRLIRAEEERNAEFGPHM